MRSLLIAVILISLVMAPSLAPARDSSATISNERSGHKMIIPLIVCGGQNWQEFFLYNSHSQNTITEKVTFYK